jgi:cell division protein FtsW (lipid II flippase)
MTARTIVGACGLLAIVGIAIYLLAQIPWEYTLGGVAALVGIFVLVVHDAPDAL